MFISLYEKKRKKKNGKKNLLKHFHKKKLKMKETFIK